MSNMKGINEYKSNLESCSSNLMKLMSNLPNQTLSEKSFVNGHNSAMIDPCSIWNWLERQLVGHPGQGDGILDDICDILKDILCNGIVQNYALRKELIRALKLCECLSQAIRQINCNNGLENLVGKLFCLLVQIILAVLAVIAKIIILLIFCRDNGCSYNDRDILSSFCKCLICDLEKELDQIEKLIDELNKLAIMFITYSAKKCKSDKPYYNCNCCNNWESSGYYEDRKNNQDYTSYGNDKEYKDYTGYINNQNDKDYDNNKNYDHYSYPCKKNKPYRD